MGFSIPWHALAGGMLLGVSAVILMLFNGKIAGISGAINGVIQPKKNEFSWRLIFLIGMVLSLYLVKLFGFSLPDISNSNLLLVGVAGALVGFGTRVANGCTSGHGIVGIGRFSKRSIIATLIFITTAIATVTIRKLTGV